MLIKATNFTVRFDTQVVFSNMDFEVPKGKIVAIRGSNGSGKTTILKSILGTVKYEGQLDTVSDISKLYVPVENDKFLYPWYSVEKNLELFNRSDFIFENRLKKMLPIICQGNFKKKVYKLSTGQKSILSIIVGIESNANLLLFDETFSVIDKKLNELIFTELQSMVKERSLTIMFTSHNTQIVSEFADLIIDI